MQKKLPAPEAGWESRTDEELAISAKTSVEAEGALLSRYLRLIRFHAGRYALNGDVDDLVQEGLIALLAAIPQFNPGYQKSFSTFAQVCICNRMRSFVRRELRMPAPAEELLERLDAQGELVDPETPESIFIRKESLEHARMQVMAMLSDREWEILQCLLSGFSYAETANRLGLSVKAVDNAMQRIRRKMRTVRSADHSDE